MNRYISNLYNPPNLGPFSSLHGRNSRRNFGKNGTYFLLLSPFPQHEKNGTVGSLPSWGDLYAKEKTPKKTVQPFPLVSILYRYQSLICPANRQRMLGVKPFLPSGLDVVGLWPTSCAIRTVHTCLALQLRSRNFGASELRLSRPCRSRPLYRKKNFRFFQLHGFNFPYLRG